MIDVYNQGLEIADFYQIARALPVVDQRADLHHGALSVLSEQGLDIQII